MQRERGGARRHLVLDELHGLPGIFRSGLSAEQPLARLEVPENSSNTPAGVIISSTFRHEGVGKQEETAVEGAKQEERRDEGEWNRDEMWRGSRPEREGGRRRAPSKLLGIQLVFIHPDRAVGCTEMDT